jgi:hypothetical protein
VRAEPGAGVMRAPSLMFNVVGGSVVELVIKQVQVPSYKEEPSN